MQACARFDESHITEQRLLSDEDLPFEFFLNALRLCDGVAARLFTDHTGLPLSLIEPTIAAAQQKGLIKVTDGVIAPTTWGLRHLNELQALFLD